MTEKDIALYGAALKKALDEGKNGQTIVITDKVELYLFDASNNLLQKMNLTKKGQQEHISYAVGEGLIGAAAEHRFIMMREHFNKLYPKQADNEIKIRTLDGGPDYL